MRTISPKEQFYCQYVGCYVRHPGAPGVFKQLVLSAEGKPDADECISVSTAVTLNWPIQLRLASQMTDDEAVFIGKTAYTVMQVTKTPPETLARLGRAVLDRPHLSARVFRSLVQFGILVPVSVVEPGYKLRVIDRGEAISAGWCEVKLAYKSENLNYTNEEYLDLHGHDDVKYPPLRNKITCKEYAALSENDRAKYERFCGFDEVYYIKIIPTL